VANFKFVSTKNPLVEPNVPQDPLLAAAVVPSLTHPQYVPSALPNCFNVSVNFPGVV
jgi:hypothetical protein